MSGCLMAGALALALGPSGSFSLEWTHSVERQSWREEWRVEGDRLRLIRAAVKGSGAGMEPGSDGRFAEGWWVWLPDLPPVPELVLAASGATEAGWQLCATTCTEIGADPAAPVRIAPCAAQPGR